MWINNELRKKIKIASYTEWIHASAPVQFGFHGKVYAKIRYFRDLLTFYTLHQHQLNIRFNKENIHPHAYEHILLII